MKLHKDSHVDHGLTARQLAHVLLLFDGRDAFFKETITLPDDLGTVPCGLFGPIMGDKPITPEHVRMLRRGEQRSHESRLIRPDSPYYGRARRVDTISVIAGPHDGHSCILYTAFGGPIAPKEPGDPTLADGTAKGRAEISESIAFWSEHALAF